MLTSVTADLKRTEGTKKGRESDNDDDGDDDDRPKKKSAKGTNGKSRSKR